MNATDVEARAAAVILDRGVRYRLGEDGITIRPLRFGTLLAIAERVCATGLTLEKIEAGENDLMRFVTEYGQLMLDCVALAELNGRDALADEKIRERTDFYRDALHAYQLYELFVQVLNLSGIQAFTNTIRLLLAMKTKQLSPRVQGS